MTGYSNFNVFFTRFSCLIAHCIQLNAGFEVDSMAVFSLSYQKYDSRFFLPFSSWLLMLTTSKGFWFCFFFNSSHTFGCHLEVLGSGRIISHNIWIPFPFLISVSFSCILKESTHNDNPPFLRSYISCHSVQRYQCFLIDSHFQPVWHKALHCCNRFCFGGSRGKQRSSSMFSVIFIFS